MMSQSGLALERGIFIFILSSFFSWKVSAQEKRGYSISQAAVPGTNIRCITQDSKGFLWVGTQDGLFRYDSKIARAFNKNENPKNAIGGSDVRDAAESKDAIWITSTQGGVDKISKTTAQPVLHLPQSKFPGLGTNTITSLAVKDSVVFIGSEKGLFVYDERHRQVYGAVNVNPPNVYIDKIALYGNYLLIFLRDWGIVSYDISSGKIAHSIKTTLGDKQDHRFFAISRYSDNHWLLGTSAGINEIAVNANGQLAYNSRPFPQIRESQGTDVYAITIDKEKNIWFATENNLLIMDPSRKALRIVENSLDANSDFLKNIYRLYCDLQNNIWLGCQAGLFYLKNSPSLTRIFYNSSNSTSKISQAYYLYPANDSTVLATAENGLYEVNTKTRVIKELDVTQAYDFIFSDPYGRLLVSSKSGLRELRDGAFIPITDIYPEFGPYFNYTINSAVQVNNSEIVMGTENNNGILVWNFLDHTLQNITTKSKDTWLDNDIINNVFSIRENIFFVLTESSLLYFDWKVRKSRAIFLPKAGSDEQYGLFFDMCRVRNTYYLSSYGNGVLELDSNYHIRRVITTQTGLTNNSVYKLLPWKDSLIFMSTNFGLNIYDPARGIARQLFKSDGLHSNVFEETSGKVYKDVIYAGGQNGFTAIYPANLAVNKEAPRCYVTAFSVETSADVRNDSFDIEANKFIIHKNARLTTIYFSGINFSNPERTTYQYKINELDKDWVNLHNRNFVSFIGMSPRTYKMLIRAFNEDGLPGEIRTVTLVFRPKWYQTWWFATLVALWIIGILYAFYRFRISQIRKREQIRKEISADLHDDIGSTLNSIKVFLNLVMLDPSKKEYLVRIKESIQSAIISIRDIMWVLDDKLDSVHDLSNRFSQSARPLATANNIQFEQQVDGDLSSHKLSKEEKRNLYMILKESFNNTVKYAECNKFSYKMFSTAAKKMNIIIKDNGKGFDTNLASQGNGLNNMSFRAGQIGYKISIKSTPGEGTEIRITGKK